MGRLTMGAPAYVALLLMAASSVRADDLTPLMAAPGTTVTLNGATLYTIGEFPLSSDKTLECNGAQITSTGGPMRVSGAGVRFVVDNCRIQGDGWALLGALAGAELVVQNGTQLTGNGANSGIYLSASTLDMTGGSIDDCNWGVNMENADAALHDVTITDTTFGLQNVAGAVTLDGGCQLTNLNVGNPGTGVALIASNSYPSRAATGVIRDTTFTGFANAVDVQPTAAQGLPAGTVDIEDSVFDHSFVSALSTVDAVNVRFARSRVVDAQADGIFLLNSTGVIEDSAIVDSLNTGMTFYGCPNGATIRNSLVSGSVHQGVAVAVDPVNDRPSSNIRVLDSTLKGNVLANLLVDDRSDAIVHGNIFSGAPDASIRLHGAPEATLTGVLVLDSHAGLEVKDSANVAAVLSAFHGHARYGALAYANASGLFSHCAFDDNGKDAVIADYSLFANTGAQLTVARCSFGPAGTRGLYNGAGNTLAATYNYWSDPLGPALLSGGGGAGAILGWDTSNSSRVTYEPFVAQAGPELQINRGFQLSASTTTQWTPGTDLSLSLTGAVGIVPVSGGLVAAMRVRDTSALTAPRPPDGTFDDGVVVVWAEYDLLSRAGSGELRLGATDAAASASLTRLDPGGNWMPVTTTWDAGTSQLVYAPADVRMLNGVFALGDGVPDPPCATARECLEGPMAGPLCAEPLNPKLQKTLGKKMRGALTKLTKASATTNTRKAAKLVRQARKLLQSANTLAARFVQVKKKPISATCRDAIIEALRPALERIDAGAP